MRSDHERITKSIQETGKAAKNLAEAIAKCGSSDTLLHELQVVEKEKRELEFQLLVQRSEGYELDSGRELTGLVEEVFKRYGFWI